MSSTEEFAREAMSEDCPNYAGIHSQGVLMLSYPEEFREASVRFAIEYHGNNPARIWIENMVTQRIECVHTQDRTASQFLEELVNEILEVGEESHAPWRTRRDTA